MTREDASLNELWRQRECSAFLRWSLCFASVGALGGLMTCLGDLDDLFSPRRLANLERFLSEVVPYPLSHPEQARETFGEWAGRLGTTMVVPGVWNTLLLSIVAAGVAGGMALLSLPGSARSLACPKPFESGPVIGGDLARCWGWRMVVFLTRGVQILGRALPEYILAFLLVGLLGLGYWPAILALAIHNGGILGRLGAEVVENVPPTLPRVLRATGSGRSQIFWLGLLPMLLGRFLVFFFYRWETCVREATVLGFVGVGSLGLFIQDTRARDLYDEMMVLVLAGAGLVLLGDLVSVIVRARLGGGGRRC